MPENSTITILVVDDEEGLRKTIAFDFKRRGFNVLTAENGRQAFELIRNNKVDLVLSDVRMPNGDGVELLDKAKSYNPELPVIMFITGFADLSLADAYDKGADAVFSKPFDRKSLMAAVVKAITAKEDRWTCRKSERVDVAFRISLKIAELNFAAQGRVLNIGRGGMFVALNEAFPPVEAKISYEIQFEQGPLHQIEGEGIVRWIRTQPSEEWKTGCGIEFESLSDTSRLRIIELISQIKTKAFIPKN